ncbi:peptidylprolyl isomerase [Rubrobacter marinus]|uniref:peptidylprolyl isomerase n=1 Tax=Rubrobacter marinus TaxID=2653852 RepID=UPI001407439D|nr:peptidylprolyl isomerase [Rubrobacter marinus]
MIYLLYRKTVLVASAAVLAIFVLSGCGAAPPGEEVDSGAKKVVTYQGGEITEGEVVEGVERLSAQSAASTGQPAPEVRPGSPEFEAAKAQVVPQLLTTDLALSYAEENDITVSDEEVQAEIDNTKQAVAQQAQQQGQEGDPEQLFGDALQQFGFTEASFREEVRTGLTVQKVQGEVAGGDAPTEEEVRAYYDENKETQFTQPEQRCIRHILFNKEGEDLANEVKGEIEDGGDFAALAAEHSQDPSNKDQGGDLGCVPEGQFVPEFDEAAFGAEEGELLGPVETEFGFHLIEVTEIRPEGETPFEEVAPQIEEQITAEQQAGEFQAWVDGELESRDVRYMPGYDPNAPVEAPEGAVPEGGAPPEEGAPEGAAPEAEPAPEGEQPQE